MNKLKIKNIIILSGAVIFFIIVGVTFVLEYINNNYLIITKVQYSSIGQEWKYELSEEGILEEYKQFDSILFTGPSRREIYVFKIINDGEISIKWLYYNAEMELKEDKSYVSTYLIEDNKVTLIKSETLKRDIKWR